MSAEVSANVPIYEYYRAGDFYLVAGGTVYGENVGMTRTGNSRATSAPTNYSSTLIGGRHWCEVSLSCVLKRPLSGDPTFTTVVNDFVDVGAGVKSMIPLEVSGSSEVSIVCPGSVTEPLYRVLRVGPGDWCYDCPYNAIDPAGPLDFDFQVLATVGTSYPTSVQADSVDNVCLTPFVSGAPCKLSMQPSVEFYVPPGNFGYVQWVTSSISPTNIIVPQMARIARYTESGLGPDVGDIGVKFTLGAAGVGPRSHEFEVAFGSERHVTFTALVPWGGSSTDWTISALDRVTVSNPLLTIRPICRM